MYTHCLVCRTPFPHRGELDSLPHGEWVAYDPLQGRLWMVCRSCKRWSLVPLESRWETLEELEGLVSGEARLLSRTNAIALFQTGSLRIIRVGKADLSEESWWRFGQRAPVRSRFSPWTPPLVRRFLFGELAWAGQEECSQCGFLFHDLPFADRMIIQLSPSDDGGSFSVFRRCPGCKDAHLGGFRLHGIEAELTLNRIMAYQNFLGESRVTVSAAARLVQNPQDPHDLVTLLSRHGKSLGDMPPLALTALEIVVVAARERTMLRLETEELQARWRREEELAALIDGELTPMERLHQLARRVRGRG
jgi:hypothetical protein